MSPTQDYQVTTNLINRTLQNIKHCRIKLKVDIFKQNFLMLRCAHAHYLEHILIVSINKIPQLIKQKSNNFYLILQTILCVYYEQKRLIEMVKISTGFHTTNNDACLKAQKQTQYRHLYQTCIVHILKDEFYQIAELHSTKKKTF